MSQILVQFSEDNISGLCEMLPRSLFAYYVTHRLFRMCHFKRNEGMKILKVTPKMNEKNGSTIEWNGSFESFGYSFFSSLSVHSSVNRPWMNPLLPHIILTIENVWMNLEQRIVVTVFLTKQTKGIENQMSCNTFKNDFIAKNSLSFIKRITTV